MTKTRNDLERIAIKRWGAIDSMELSKRKEAESALQFDLLLEIACQLADLRAVLSGVRYPEDFGAVPSGKKAHGA